MIQKYRVPLSDADIAEMAARNEARARAARESLGELYLLHPANAAERRPARVILANRPYRVGAQ